MPTPDKGECINQVKRDVQVTIFRLRSQHIQLNQHLNRIGINTDAKCLLCRWSEESVHFIYLNAFDDLRISFLHEVPNLINTIYGTPEQLRFHTQISRHGTTSKVFSPVTAGSDEYMYNVYPFVRQSVLLSFRAHLSVHTSARLFVCVCPFFYMSIFSFFFCCCNSFRS